MDSIPVDEKTARSYQWATAAHLTALSLYMGLAFVHILIPLFIWLFKRAEYPFVDENGKESVNFQISVTIYGLVTGVLCLVLVGFLIIPALLIFHIVCVVKASIRASKGESYRYPLCLRFIR